MRLSLITSVPLNPPWDQGDKNFAYMLARAMPDHIFEVLTSRHAPPPQGANLRRRPLFASPRPTLWQKAAVYINFWRQWNDPRTDLYHFIYRPYRLSSCMARLVPAFRRRPTIHTIPATAGPDALNRDLFFAGHVVTQSERGRRRLLDLGLKNVSHIPAAVDTRRWAAVATHADHHKAALGFAGHPTVLYPGHYGPGYGADVLLEALPLILRRAPQARFIFACRRREAQDVQRENAVRRRLEEAGIRHVVRLYSTVADMERLVGAADVTVLPLETMHNKVDIPTTLLESLAAARPIVMTDLSPMNELLDGRNGKAGAMIAPGDALALAESVTELLTNTSLRRRMGACGQSLVFKRYDVTAVAAQYDRLYRTLLS